MWCNLRSAFLLEDFRKEGDGQRPVLDIVQNLIYNSAMQGSPSDLLREHDVPVTAQRLAVLRAVSARPHCTVDDIAGGVRAEIGTISRQSVYDTLAILADRGLIRRIQPAGSPSRYEVRVGDNHHHAICRICGKTADVDCVVGHAPCLTAADCSGYQIDEAEVIFWGICPACQSAKQNAASGPARESDAPNASAPSQPFSPEK